MRTFRTSTDLYAQAQCEIGLGRVESLLAQLERVSNRACHGLPSAVEKRDEMLTLMEQIRYEGGPEDDGRYLQALDEVGAVNLAVAMVRGPAPDPHLWMGK